MVPKQPDLVRQLRRRLINDFRMRYSGYDNTWRYRETIEITIPAQKLADDPSAALEGVPAVFAAVVDEVLARYERILTERRRQFAELAETEMN